ncbi:MAG: TetR family transcriptional regulator [Methylobacterium sp.]|nr:TetR family transcriptional regulator [Methylobacterium sp.]
MTKFVIAVDLPSISADPTGQAPHVNQPERDTRQSIVDTAERFFRDIGYQKTTVADIAKSLRMSPANVYRFFDSKKSINEAVLARFKGELEESLSLIIAEPRPAGARLRDMLLTSHRINQARFADQQRMQEMVCAAMEESWDAILGHIERFDALLSRVVAEGVASGEFRAIDPVAATQCIRTAMMRFQHPLLMAQCERIPGPSAEEMIAFIMAALEVPKPAG